VNAGDRPIQISSDGFSLSRSVDLVSYLKDNAGIGQETVPSVGLVLTASVGSATEPRSLGVHIFKKIFGEG
jgi:hypothetical protein